MKLASILIMLFLLAALCPAKENILLVNYGPKQSIREGDDDFQQMVFFKIAGTITDSLYVRIFDIDCGGENDLAFGDWNTETSFTLYGGQGSCSPGSLASAKPVDADISAGKILATRTCGENSELDNAWFNLARLSPADGEKIDGNWFFKLVIQGKSGNDANAFDVRLSASATMNTAIDGMEMYSHSPTLRLRKDENVANITFHAPQNTKSVSVHNFDLAGASLQLITAFRSNLQLVASGQGEWVESVLPLEPIETGRDCAIALGQGEESPNDVSLFITDDQERLLPIRLPIDLITLNRRPTIQKSLIALSDCQSLVFDAQASRDADGDVLDFVWDFGDGSTAAGSRVVHRYDLQKTYSAQLIVSDNSGAVGNSSFERFQVTVNQPPVAVAGNDITTAPNKVITFDGSRSFDQDGRLTQFNWEFGDGQAAAGAVATHSYINPGTFRALLRVNDNSTSPCNFATDEVKVWVNAPPLARAGEDTKGSVGKSIAFSGEKSSDDDGELVAYVWDFGDAGKATGKIVQHQYTAPGQYRVKLSVTDNAQVSNSTQSDELLVFINDPPMARAGQDCKGAIEESLAFDAGRSSDKDGVIAGYTWDFGDGARQEGKQVSHSYKKSGKYTVVLTVQDNSGTESNTNSDTLQVFINQPPVADAGPDQLLTASEAVFSAKNSHDGDGEIVKYEWDFGDGVTAIGVSAQHAYAKPGTYQAKVTVTDNSGTKNNQSSDLVTVVINEKPLADAGPDQKIAIGQAASFDGSGSRDADGAIATYAWDFGDGTTAAGKSVTHIYRRSGIFTSRLTVADNTGQDQAVDFDEAVVTVNSQPVAVAGPDMIVEPGSTVLFDAAHSYDADQDTLSFSWQFSDAKGQTNTIQSRRSFTSAGIYAAFLTVSDRGNTGNNQAQDTVVVRVNSAPIANAGKSFTSCEKTLAFDGSASVDPDGDPIDFTWDFGDGSALAHGSRPLHNYARGGVYPVILTVDDGLGLKNSRSSTSITAAINEPPIADAGKNETHCSGDVIIFNAGNSKDPERGLLKYTWDFGDSTFGEGLNPTKIYKNAGVYLVMLTVKDDSGLPCNTDIAAKTVEIIESPVAMAGPDQQVCTNTPVFFDGSASRDFDGVVNSHFWDFGDGATGGGATPSHSYKRAGVYRVVLTITGDQRGDCDNTDTDELLVTVLNAPLAQAACPAIAPVQQPVSFDGSASVSEGAAISDYLWDFGDGSQAHGAKVNHSYQKSGNYIVKMTIYTQAATICNSAMVQKLIIINAAPIADAGSEQKAGINQFITLDGRASKDPDGALESFRWDFDDQHSESGIVVRHRFSRPGRHPVVLTVVDHSSAANNTARDTVWVTVNDPVSPVISVKSTKACPGEIITFDAGHSKNIQQKNVGCYWDFGDGKSAQGIQVTHAYAKSGRYDVSLMMDDGLMLDDSRTDTSITMIINSQPVAVAGSDRSACAGQELIFDASKSFDSDDATWLAEWDFGDGVKATEKVVRHSYAKAGQYPVTLRIIDHSAGNCAVGQDVVTVTINSQPIARAGEDRQVFCGGAHDAVLFDATASTDADGDGLTYEWDFGNGVRYHAAKFYHTFERPGLYIVKLTVDDGRKTICSQSRDDVKITVLNRK